MSGIEYPANGKVYAAMAAIMAEIGGVAKTRKNQQQGYAFRGIADITLAAQPLMAKHGVVLVPHEVLTDDVKERETKSGGVMHHIRQRIVWRFYASDGSYVQAVTTGEAMDTGDKTSNKVMSAAMKYALVQAFCIPEEDPDDADATTPEESKPKAKQAPRTLPLSPEEEQKLANWEAGLETHHAPEQLQVAREKAAKISSAALKAQVMGAIERWAKAAA